MKINNVGSNMTELSTNSGAVVLFSYSTPVAAMLPSGQYIKTYKSIQPLQRDTLTNGYKVWLLMLRHVQRSLFPT